MVIADLLRSKGGYPAPHETLLSARMAGGQYKLRHPPLLRLNLLSFDTTGLQAGNEIFLAADEDDEHGEQACHRHGKDVAPLRELVLAEKARYGDGQRALLGVVQNRQRPREFFPRRQKIENADGRDGRTGQWADNLEEHSEYAAAVHVDGLVEFSRNALNVALDHKRGKRNDPGHIERHQPQQLVRELEERGELILRNDERRAWDDHRADDKRKERPSAGEAEARQTEGQRRRDKGRDHDGQHGDDRAVQKIDVELFLAEDVRIIFQRNGIERGKKLRRELIERTVWLQGRADHIDHRHDRYRAAEQQKHMAQDVGREFPFFQCMHGSPSYELAASFCFMALNCRMARKMSVTATTNDSAAA